MFPDHFTENQIEITKLLHDYFVEYGLDYKIRWKVPFYFRRSWVCYIWPQKKGPAAGGVELCFIRAKELSLNLDLLDFDGRSQVASIKIKTINDINYENISLVIDEALELDKHVDYTNKK